MFGYIRSTPRSSPSFTKDPSYNNLLLILRYWSTANPGAILSRLTDLHCTLPRALRRGYWWPPTRACARYLLARVLLKLLLVPALESSNWADVACSRDSRVDGFLPYTSVNEMKGEQAVPSKYVARRPFGPCRKDEYWSAGVGD